MSAFNDFTHDVAFTAAAAADGAATLLVWVLEDNPARTFYLRRGARRVGRRRIEVGGASLAEIAYAIG